MAFDEEKSGMNRTFIIIFALTLGIFAAFFEDTNSQAADAPAVGGTLPDINLPVSQDHELNRYLGIDDTAGNKHFKVPQIKAEFIILEVFNMYCPHCQREAPVVNELYKSIQGSPELKDKIKLIGIGAGNSSFEVDFFRKKYNILFPLFTDQDYSIHTALGKVGTPFFIVIKNNPDRTYKILYSAAGSFGEPQQFLKFIMSNA